MVDVVAQLVAAVLPAAEAQALVEGLLGAAAEGRALLVGVDQRVDEQVDGALVGALDQLVHVCEGRGHRQPPGGENLGRTGGGGATAAATRTLEPLDALQGDSHQRVLDVAARLEGSPVGVDVDVPHGSLDADAAVRGPSGVGVEDVHELGVVGGEGVLVVRVFEGGTCRVQAYGGEGRKKV